METRIRQYRTDGYSCSESILRSFNDEYNLKLDDTALKAASGFSGGLCTEDVCGIVTAGVMVIGVLFTEERIRKSPKTKEVTTQFVTEFKKVYKSTNCAMLKEHYYKEDTGCMDLIVESGLLLDKIIKKHL